MIPDMLKLRKDHELSTVILETLSANEFYAGNNSGLNPEWFSLKMDEACQHIEEWKVNKVLQSISHIGLKELVSIKIRGNDIESVEGIHRIKMPFLQLLWIDDNCIRSISQLSKGCLPDLTTLYISKAHNR